MQNWFGRTAASCSSTHKGDRSGHYPVDFYDHGLPHDRRRKWSANRKLPVRFRPTPVLCACASRLSDTGARLDKPIVGWPFDPARDEVQRDRIDCDADLTDDQSGLFRPDADIDRQLLAWPRMASAIGADRVALAAVEDRLGGQWAVAEKSAGPLSTLQRPLSLHGGNRSSCPKAVIQTAALFWRGVQGGRDAA